MSRAKKALRPATRFLEITSFSPPVSYFAFSHFYLYDNYKNELPRFSAKKVKLHYVPIENQPFALEQRRRLFPPPLASTREASLLPTTRFDAIIPTVNNIMCFIFLKYRYANRFLYIYVQSFEAWNIFISKYGNRNIIFKVF